MLLVQMDLHKYVVLQCRAAEGHERATTDCLMSWSFHSPGPILSKHQRYQREVVGKSIVCKSIFNLTSSSSEPAGWQSISIHRSQGCGASWRFSGLESVSSSPRVFPEGNRSGVSMEP